MGSALPSYRARIAVPIAALVALAVPLVLGLVELVKAHRLTLAAAHQFAEAVVGVFDRARDGRGLAPAEGD